jgi:hypothetical protein
MIQLSLPLNALLRVVIAKDEPQVSGGKNSLDDFKDFVSGTISATLNRKGLAIRLADLDSNEFLSKSQQAYSELLVSDSEGFFLESLRSHFAETFLRSLSLDH